MIEHIKDVNGASRQVQNNTEQLEKCLLKKVIMVITHFTGKLLVNWLLLNSRKVTTLEVITPVKRVITLLLVIYW